jgi:hypothetical protein
MIHQQLQHQQSLPTLLLLEDDLFFTPDQLLLRASMTAHAS